jgi:L-threonylcarbamoyladenylate synthase
MYTTVIGKDIKKAGEWLQKNEVVAIPTETVYGLAANALSEHAVQKIFSVKQRPLSNPLILHVADSSQIAEFTHHIPEAARQLLAEFSPGPITVLLPKNSRVPSIVTAGLPTVAVRIPDHPLTLSLIRETGLALAAPSANPFGYISPTCADHVMKMLHGKIRYILDGGACIAGIESTIVGFPGGRPTLYREGAISREQIARVAGALRSPQGTVPRVPGMLPRHYQPHTPLVICHDVEAELAKYQHLRVGLITYDSYSNQVPVGRQLLLTVNGQLQEAARNLYAAMHDMDERGYQLIIVKKLPETGIGLAINDRLLRAAKS